ncbi:MAG: dTDP-4-dehydrorhamnose reductase [Oligoflexia bacterium]|nr:dTDP-4-dehydrorhamnose reductase [Oligoflexia bacterium]
MQSFEIPEPILIFGANGQLGSAFSRLLGERAIALTRAEADLSRPESIVAALEKHQPRIVINAAAYTAVDLAEQEEYLAHRLNAEAPGTMARWCSGADAVFLQYSTDYVFSGEGDRPWREDDPACPLNAYGRTKLAGERLVMEAGGRSLIFRVSWVYSAHGKNFFNTMLRLGQERERLSVVADQHGAPSFATELAEHSLLALDRALRLPSFPRGIYHLCPSGETTWHGFASEIFKLARESGIPLKLTELKPIPSSEYPSPARRPANSRLNTAKIRALLGGPLPPWDNGLRRCMETLR